MKVLVIGGTGFIGPHVVRGLADAGHDVAVFHRGAHSPSLPSEVVRIAGDRQRLAAHRRQIEAFAPEVVIDLILSSGRQAVALMEAMRGIAGRVVAASSMDVYRACTVVHGTEEGLEPLPLTEASALRTRPAYPPEQMAKVRSVFGWVDDEYDKIPVERAVLSDPALAGTVLRLPMVYGPGDPLHRFFPVVKRMDDGRPALLFSDDLADWRASRGYVENVAAAIVLAAVDDRARGRLYNVAEPEAATEREWAARVAAIVGWKGELVTRPRERMPAHLVVAANLAQHWVASSDRIRQELGYREPVPLEEALRRTIAWERAHPPAIDPQQFDYPAEDDALSLP